MRSIGYGEGLSTHIRLAESPPRPKPSASTSPRKRGEVRKLISLAPFLRGEGWGEGLPPRIRLAESPPHPKPSASTSPRKRGEVRKLDFLAALLHFGAEHAVDGFAEVRRPLLHIGHAELDRPGLGRKQFLAERGFVEGDEVLQFLLGKLVGVDLRHAVADLLLAAGEVFRDDGSDLGEVLLIIEV